MSRRQTTSGSNTVLIFQPDHLGDILLSQPAVRIIREQFPNHRLIGVVGPWSETIARLVWPVDEIVTVDFPGFNRESTMKSPLAPYLQLLREAATLGKLNAGVSFVLRPDAWWAAWLAALATAGPVVTSDDPRTASFGTHCSHIAEDDHATARVVAIARAMADNTSSDAPRPESLPLWMPENPAAHDEAQRFLQARGVHHDYVVIHPGSGADVKQWPRERWRAVVNGLGLRDTSILITGNQSEREMAQSIAGTSGNALSIAGQTPLPVLIEILRGARLVVGPDSGPLHLAVACGTRTIHLFGPSDPVRYGPWGPPDRHRVVRANWSCSRCGDLSVKRPAGCGCMVAIQPHTVICAVNELLDDHANE